MSVRNLVYVLLKDDPLLHSMGFAEESVMPNFSMDSPAARLQRWITIRWGIADAPVGRDATARPINMGIWVYNRERDYGPIGDALRRCRVIMADLYGVPQPGGGHLVQADWAGSSEDLYDDSYEAVMRGEDYRVVTTLI